ncbi:c-type cytochrome biogenesis protein CcmI [Thalassospira sp.]|uniref:c-type cytochrome biogenesis protein CcmI n=1 Tax=Thalassospira sp. TaxID=1912094 RepID=UPI0027348F4D|nr:c-type cytochrome biogenesis protein CcmI [Thalassospira sp.]MDP2699502.1 c-type cytochrome biogenesis protein CcmI [Thalassospira sp.]
MTIWIIITAVTLLVAGYVLWPLRHPHRAAGTPDNGNNTDDDAVPDELTRDLAVYRDQLDEIGRDIERGVLSGEQATAARIEVQRRILATDQRIQDRAGKTKPGGAAIVRPIVAGFVAISILAGLGLYLDLGSPQTPDRPIVSRADEIAAIRASQQQDQSRQGALNRAVADLSNRLIENPDDLEGWELLGNSLMALGRPEDAQTAFLETIRLSDRSGDYLAMYAESVIRSNTGQITPAAYSALQEAADTTSRDPRIPYYLGMYEAQNGDGAAAVERWIVLVNNAPADANWLPMVLGRIDEVARVEGIDLTGRITLAPSAARGPSEEDMKAAAEMTPEERAAMIEDMVGRLADRLAENPDDPDGWVRLMQAYMVTNRPEQARTAYQDARTALAGQPDILERLDDIARDMGVPAG